MSRAKMFYDISKRTEGLVSGNDFITLDEVQTISFTDVDEMRAALKGYLESGVFTVGNLRAQHHPASFYVATFQRKPWIMTELRICSASSRRYSMNQHL